MQSEKLFYDDEFAALRWMIETGVGYQKTAGHLWPDMKAESAYAKLKACTSSGGDQRLKFGEIIAAMKFNGRYDPLFYACDETLHMRPARKEVREEQQRLVAAIEEASTVMTRAMEALEKLKGESRPMPRVVGSSVNNAA